MKNNNRKLFLLTLTISLLAINFGFCQEGLWLPPKLNRQESKMQKLGLKIPVEKIYNETGTGLNNAVVLFGSGCTAEIISGQGLLLTNHHCGYGYAQRLSSPEHNYLKDGFWAMDRSEELPCPGLTVTFTRKIKNVTGYILKDLTDTMPEALREKEIKNRIENLEKGYENTEHLDAVIKPFYNGNQYWVVLREKFEDVRLVAFPPNGIGNFGGDTDNWMWPRMTGDFSVFRVYASKDNKPAPYSINNVPYRPETFLPVSTSGYKEGDFTMVYGFPYRTEEYITSFQLNQIENIIYPIRITARAKRLAVLDKAMREDPEVFLKYAKKQAAISNGYKKWQGALEGLSANNVIAKKEAYQKSFAYAAAGNNDYPGDRMLLPRIKAAVDGSENAVKASEYIHETVMGVEAVHEAAKLDKILMIYRRDTSALEMKTDLQHIKKDLAGFYKDYDAPTDRKVFEALVPLYMKQGSLVVAPKMKDLFYNAGNDYAKWAGAVVNNSIVTNREKMYAILDEVRPEDTNLIKEDPAFRIYAAVKDFKAKNVEPELENYQRTIKPLNRIYMKRQMEYLNSGREFYPDANQTLRLSYGQVKSLDLPSGNKYQTTLDDLIPRHDVSIAEFNIPKGLRDLYLNRDYGRWAVNGTVPIDFIATNHTSGGNSGSPVLNGKGQLIGINFDRVWQGTMSDFYFDPARCRNISVDIRYILFIIEKYGHAGWLLQEMDIEK
jgi:hypothetical protein